MARMLRSHASIAMENIVLWHERDISHSSTERMYLPDNFGILFYSLERLSDTVDDLIFHQEVIEERVKSQHGYLSSYYLHYLIEKTDLKREDLYYHVQEAAFAAAKSGQTETFHTSLVEAMSKLGFSIELESPNFEQVKKIYLNEVDRVFERSFTLYPLP
jgi:adenylosuccinate lyase